SKPLYCWSAGIEGSLDQRACGVLPAGADDFLDSPQVRWPFSLAIPSTKCAFARRVSSLALAGLAATECSRRLVGRGAMGVAPSDGPISRVGNRAEKHAIGLFLSIVDLLFFEMERETADDADITDQRRRRSFSKSSALSAVGLIAALLHP